MLKRNLFLLIVIGIAFVFTTNAFGQNNKTKRTKPIQPKPGRSLMAEQYNDVIKKPKTTQRTKNPRRKIHKPSGDGSTNQFSKSSTQRRPNRRKN